MVPPMAAFSSRDERGLSGYTISFTVPGVQRHTGSSVAALKMVVSAVARIGDGVLRIALLSPSGENVPMMVRRVDGTKKDGQGHPPLGGVLVRPSFVPAVPRCCNRGEKRERLETLCGKRSEGGSPRDHRDDKKQTRGADRPKGGSTRSERQRARPHLRLGADEGGSGATSSRFLSPRVLPVWWSASRLAPAQVRHQSLFVSVSAKGAAPL